MARPDFAAVGKLEDTRLIPEIVGRPLGVGRGMKGVILREKVREVWGEGGLGVLDPCSPVHFGYVLVHLQNRLSNASRNAFLLQTHKGG